MNRSTYLDGIHVITKVLDFEFGSTQRLGSGFWLSGLSGTTSKHPGLTASLSPAAGHIELIEVARVLFIMSKKQKTKASGWDPSLTVHAPCMPALNSCCPSGLLIWE